MNAHHEPADTILVTRTTTESASPFDTIHHIDDEGTEYWSARELMSVLGYDKWERFEGSIHRARESAAAQGHSVADHFPGSGKMVRIGSGIKRQLVDYKLTRFACYLVAMNGDPRKSQIAAAQGYFAIRTRQAEIQERTTTTTDALTPEHQLALLRNASDLLSPEETRLRVRHVLDQAIGAPLDHTRAHSTDTLGIESSIELFWRTVRPRLIWDLVPFTFLYDLYATTSDPDHVLSSRQQFVASIVQLVDDDPAWRCPDKSRKIRPRHLMQAHEPLIAEHGLTQWIRPMRTQYRGLLRRARSLTTDSTQE